MRLAASILLTLAVLLLAGPGHAQTIFLQQWSVEDGLAQSQVLDVMQDNSGYLWMATYGGVSRYNGREFLSYGLSDGLGSSSVRTVLQDAEGAIWFGTYGGGLSLLNPEMGDSLPIRTFSTSNGWIENDYIFHFTEDHSGQLWLATNGGGAIVMPAGFEESGIPLPVKTITEADGLPSNRVYAIHEDAQHRIWIGTWKGLAMYDPTTEQLVSYTTDNGLPMNFVVSLYEDHKGTLWAGTYGKGVAHINLNQLGDQFIPFHGNDELPGGKVVSMTEDADGNFWFGTYGGGACRYDGKRFTVLNQNVGLPSNHVWAVFEDHENNIWLGTNGSGVAKFTGDKFTSYTTDNGVVDNMVFAVLEQARGEYVFGTAHGVSRFDAKGLRYQELTTKDGMKNDHVWALHEDRSGNLWIGTSAGVEVDNGSKLTHYGTEDGLSNRVVNTIFEDAERRIWLGTNAGITRYHEGTFTNYTLNTPINNSQVFGIVQDHESDLWLCTNKGVFLLPSNLESADSTDVTLLSEAEGLSMNMVIAGAFGPNNRLWLGTYGGGINVIKNPRAVKRGKPAQWDVISRQHGMSDDAVASLVFDARHNLVAGTNKGLNCIDLSNYDNNGLVRVKAYTPADGFLGMECNQNAILKDRSGAIWVGTVKGVVRYNPAADRPNEVEPVTHLNRLLIDHKPAGFRQEGEFASDENHLTFEFIGISLQFPEKVAYQYKLEGLDKDWSPAKAENYATYPSIPPGTYTFMVRASNNDGLWNGTPSTYTFTIATPFWQTWWFISLTVLVLAYVVFAAVRLRIRKLKAAKRKLEAMVDARTRELATAYHDLKKLEGFKQSMMGMIVHDLKNPLAQILSVSKQAPGKKNLETIYQGGRQMLNLVMNILDVQKFEGAEIQLDQADISLWETVNQAFAQVTFLAQNKGLMLENNTYRHLGVFADNENLTRVLVNLLTNALKYSEARTIVRVEAKRVTENRQRMVAISVEDTGTGISPDKLGTIFELYAQGDSRKSGGIGSTGIGLAYCRLVVEAHGGSIEAESQPGKGTIMRFTLPEATTKIKPAATAPVQQAPKVAEPVSNGKVGPKEIQLGPAARKKLQPLKDKFQPLKVFMTSENMALLQQLEVNGSADLRLWKEELENTLFNGDQQRYEVLKKLMTQGDEVHDTCG